VLRRAFDGFQAHATAAERRRLQAFCRAQTTWLDDYAFFMALKAHQGGRPWFRWPRALRRRQPGELRTLRAKLATEIAYHQFLQHVFFEQWLAVKTYANRRGIRIIGDIPLYIAHDSADAWTQPRLFRIDGRGRATRVGGCPPDPGFPRGQLWGNPVFNWSLMKKMGFRWWVERVRASLRLYDILRIDHFIGLVHYWAIPGNSRSAARGRWLPAPGEQLLATLRRRLGPLPLIAEDLGAVTPGVIRLRERYGLPGMKILQYAFGGDSRNEFLPHHYPAASVVYTGTHDNDTMLGWLRTAHRPAKRFAAEYLHVPRPKVWDFIRLAWSSVSCLAIVPLQDVLELDTRARMNLPSTLGRNWKWRCDARRLTPRLAARLRRLSVTFGRA